MQAMGLLAVASLAISPTTSLAEDGPLPQDLVTSEVFTQAFPETGARIAVFDVGHGFREELFALDAAGVFDSDQPGQPNLAEADIILARVPSWQRAAAIFDGSTLQDLADEISALNAADYGRPFFIRPSQFFGELDVLTITVLDSFVGQRYHARCLARLVIAAVYAGENVPDYDLAACSRALN